MTNKITERQKMILSLVVHEYIRTATPIGSKRLVEQFHLDISSATVRAELATLTELGLLQQLHTSAGRYPTERGYRYFVSTLMKLQEIPEAKRRMIEHQFYQMQQDRSVESWMKLAASILASLSGAISVVSAPHAQQIGLKHVALVGVSEKQGLMILVTNSSQTTQRFITFEDPTQQVALTALENELNTLFHGQNSVEIRQTALRADLFRRSPLTRDVTENLIAALHDVETSRTGEIYTDGLRNVIDEPEFTESGEARHALKILEEKTVLQSILTKTNNEQKIGGIQVLIGGEGEVADLQNCSMVLARYGTPNLISGSVGILGPMRMRYSRNIPTVRLIAGLLSDLVSEAYLDTRNGGERPITISE